MTKFEKLCLAFTQARGRFLEDQVECLEFIEGVSVAFSEYLDVDESQVQVTALDIKKDMDIRNVDKEGFWHYMISFSLLDSSEGGRSTERVMIEILVKRKGFDHSFMVKLGQNPKTFELSLYKKILLGRFFDLILNQMSEQYERQPFRYFHQSTIRKIRF